MYYVIQLFLPPSPLYPRLFAPVPPSVLRGGTVGALWTLLDNYSPAVTARDVDTQQELREQSAFLDAVVSTRVMAAAEDFLRGKGAATDTWPMLASTACSLHTDTWPGGRC